MSYHQCGNNVESRLPSMCRMFPFCITVSSCLPRPHSCQSQPRWRHLATRRRWKSCTPYMKTRPPSAAGRSPNFCRFETSCSQTWREAKLALDWTWGDAARGPCESHTRDDSLPLRMLRFRGACPRHLAVTCKITGVCMCTAASMQSRLRRLWEECVPC